MGAPSLAIFNLPQGTELLVILVFGLLLFGKRLPDVARSIGKSIVEFKKGMKDVRDDIEKDTGDSALPKSEPPRSLPRSDSKSEDKSTAGV